MKRKLKLSQQIKKHSQKEIPESQKYDGATEQMISTGSTLLDLAVSGGRVRGGGIPGGILVELFGPSAAGKTVLLCEIAGAVQRYGGQVLFRDPEARLNKKFAQLFGLDPDEIQYDTPDTVPEVFTPIRSWEPEPENHIHGIFADSLAALSTDMEMDDKDQYGMRRAKEFSEELRKTCRVLKNKNFLLVGSNQIRDNVGAGPWEERTKSPGGKALEFYSSLRLRFRHPSKIKEECTVHGKKVKRVVGIQTTIQIYKSTIWKPYHEADVTILFDYGIDDIRENLQFVKSTLGQTVYTVQGQKLHKSWKKSIRIIEKDNLESELREQVIDLWEEIEQKFQQRRKPKKR